ncbi:leucine--tRNA ligase [Candidatus Dojkabacteria bacterium]|uniref:Leucine--tRNA ligase n=1 Tax=Candidatus Dojkabacteria bacterium TaxID=2099670 RepID=A0A5C7J7A4_9BACT|nr:MAG: leucine--tRNA ligase [Candidatus Dojkabacteria bacterium]
MYSKYQPEKIEKKWQKVWDEEGVFRQYHRPKKQYVLDMFPYPSGAGLHVGHPKGYIASDVYARFKQLEGYGVLHPMGWDAFGLPAEQYAIKNKVHPEAAVKKNIATFKKQLEKIGFTYDWQREINTTDPEYYRWTQWIFLQMWKKGLAYQSYDPINWCPSCQTGLANEDLENGHCERCGTLVEKRPMRQWVLRITAYADKMLRDLDRLQWPDSIKQAQRNWIGRSEGAEVVFYVADTEEEIHVFTTRLDTIYGCTYVVVAPEHPLLTSIYHQISNKKEVEHYLTVTKKKTDLERTELNKEKTGVWLEGVEAVHPFTGQRLPVYVADYVLGSYGTGAVMGVPAHDERDFLFAKKYDLPVIEVVAGSKDKDILTDDGVLMDSGEFTGLYSAEAREKMVAWLRKEKLGKKVVHYKMRDWVFSRQRYWGEPIPLIHCESCGVVGVPEKDLPVKLPKVKAYEPAGTGESPLATIKKWVNVKCPQCGGPAKRETNTMPQWAGSSWYYLRYIDPQNKRAFVGTKKEREMMPVDVYVGGDHATRHLIYARFWHKFLYDQKLVSTREPFARLEFLGLILASDGRKMSKRWGNVINPNDVIGEFGADAFRLYEMFMGPFPQSIAWNTDGVVGTRRFLEKVWKLSSKVTNDQRLTTNDKNTESLLHQTIKKVTEDIETFKFNTAISSLMILVNALEKADKLSVTSYQLFLVLLSPFAPHITEELWQKLGEKNSIFLAPWPKYDAKKIMTEIVKIAVQVNGKVRATIELSPEATEDEAKQIALADQNIKTFVSGKTVRKFIYVPGRIINFVVS